MCCQEKVFWKYAANLQENAHAEVWFQESCLSQLYWYHTSPWVFSCKVPEYLQSIFLEKHLWRAVSEKRNPASMWSLLLTHFMTMFFSITLKTEGNQKFSDVFWSNQEEPTAKWVNNTVKLRYLFQFISAHNLIILLISLWSVFIT